MKILHILPNLQIGGIQRFVLDLIYYQRKFPGVSVGIFVCSRENAQWESMFNSLNIPVYWGTIAPMDLNVRHYVPCCKVQKQYDIIHWHTFMPLLCLTAFFNKKKHVFTHHSVLGEGRIKQKTDGIKWTLFRWYINNRIDCEVYNSVYTQHFWQQRGIHAKRSALIYNGARFAEPPFNRSEFTDDEKNILSNKFIIGSSCNLICWKRVDILINAFYEWSKWKNDVCLLIVGDGPARVTLEELVYNLHINDKVLFVGHKSFVAFYQSMMDVCVFPSTTETFGLAALECLHQGKPTICMSDGGGICEVIGDKRDIVDSIDNMVVRFNDLYNQKKRTGSCASASYITQSNYFKMEHKAVEYIDLYKSLL